ncbi:MAG: L-seryl-tRNA(Sec) selenium transferase [Acidimicrobiales bacterium]|jgi:L-seryl-tRNA(Ser) seleniumtransferase|nr:L-seryl-tRNA(Sec) selenium transferase [Actinomycetes bacterium]MDP6104821.1 L-seryl-tRNA(Sec) selenium transferase [Acidimicrobiales bacterium]MCP4844934.1 L-seryl-tRNA(Sec) selenium transferase [Actinomycetes bacterium]MDP6241259.1 L-seryl-tRNA(Sec) selenium transferase [Acidimicrobiales bacterium]MDP7125755.1 L-seryl-tRNA(Sec) selenium transferase [Acidimicrobiales bacterium]|tara:strand:+ start:4254 stop:5531 length:1278 start_codon:yes stop_codon:yes gene_type:complete
MAPDRPPSVDRLARSLADTGLPHPLLVDAARQAIADDEPATVEARARDLAGSMGRHFLTGVVNATGVLLHTNLGRAPWGTTVDDTRYSTLEFDLSTGDRGSRQDRTPALLARACGAEAAIVVNNCASAVLLVLAALAEGRGAVVSRGELVEIGGGFRIPDVMAQSGAHLIEVGTTNRTRLEDFASAVAAAGDDAALILNVHRSNYRIEGFTESVDVSEMAGLGVPVVADIGSGLLDAACQWLADGPPPWLVGEPAARQTLEAGADLVTFSGDKLLGGPQAGIIAGRADLVETCAAHPLARALRPGSLVLHSLQDLALAYLRRDGDAIPFWRMATLTVDRLRERATTIAPDLVADTMAVPGGGTLPGVEIPSVGLRLDGDRTAELRAGTPPVVARVADQATLLDLRTVHPDDDAVLGAALDRLGAR